MIGPTADLLSLFFGLAAVFTIVQLVRSWRSLFDDRFTAEDFMLAQQCGFLLLTPVGVLVHELAHLVTAEAFGAQATALSFRFYWGFVQYAGVSDPTHRFLIAAAGPAASTVLGLAALAVAPRLQLAWAVALRVFGVSTLALVLAIYPIASFLETGGDFRTIYSPSTPTLSAVAAAIHLAAIVAAVLLARRPLRRPAPPKAEA